MSSLNKKLSKKREEYQLSHHNYTLMVIDVRVEIIKSNIHGAQIAWPKGTPPHRIGKLLVLHNDAYQNSFNYQTTNAFSDIISNSNNGYGNLRIP